MTILFTEGLGSPVADRDECNAVLEHVVDAEKAIRELARVVRPGGHVVVAVPFLQPFHPCPGDFRRYTRAAWRRSAAAPVSRSWPSSRAYFTYLCDTEVNSVAFLSTRRIPDDVLLENTVAGLTLERKIALMDRAATRFEGKKRAMMVAAKAHFLEMLAERERGRERG